APAMAAGISPLPQSDRLPPGEVPPAGGARPRVDAGARHAVAPLRRTQGLLRPPGNPRCGPGALPLVAGGVPGLIVRATPRHARAGIRAAAGEAVGESRMRIFPCRSRRNGVWWRTLLF